MACVTRLFVPRSSGRKCADAAGERTIYRPRVGDPFARATKFSRKIVTTFPHNRDKQAAFKPAPLNCICRAFAPFFMIEQAVSFPGRSAAPSPCAALRCRAGAVINGVVWYDPGSAKQRCALHRARETKKAAAVSG